MPLGQKTKAFFERLKKEAVNAPAPLPINEQNMNALRASTKALFREYAGPLPKGVSMSSFKDHTFELPDGFKINAKIYTPKSFNPSIGNTVIFFQGNGFLFDMLEAHLPGYARLADTANCQVIGVDTPLAPEHSAQEINEISYAAVHHISENASELGANSNKLVLAGYSAGGNLVANIANIANKAL